MLTLFYDANCIFVYADALNYILASKHKYINEPIANIYRAKTVIFISSCRQFILTSFYYIF